MQTGFEEPYKVLTLPRIPDIALHDKVVLALILSPDASVIDVAVSKAVISSYIIKPTPKLVWSYALGRTTIVDSLETYSDSRGNKLYVAGITERRKSRLLVLETKTALALPIDSDSNLADLGVANASELLVSSPIRGIKILKDGTAIVLVHSDGSVQLVSHHENELQLQKPNYGISRSKIKNELVYHAFIDDIQVNSAVASSKQMLLQLVKRNDRYTYNMVSLNIALGFFEINQKVMPKELCDLLIAYCANVIYQLDRQSLEITALNATTFESSITINVSSLCASNTLAQITCPAPKRLLLSLGNKVHLINLNLSSLLGTCEITAAETVFVVSAARVTGASTKTSRSMACFLTANSKNNSTDLNMVDFTLGTNTLRESLGRGFAREPTTDKIQFHGVSNLTNPQYESESLALAQETAEVYQVLKTSFHKKDMTRWEKVVVPYLKKVLWDSIQSDMKNASSPDATVDEFSECDVDSDRQVDMMFISRILSLVLSVLESGMVEFADEAFVPQYTFVYLLTHPMFPKLFTKGLLSLFRASGHEILLRQAIITCPNLPLEDILCEMIYGCTDENLRHCDTFEDSLNKLVNEFSTVAISEALRQMRDNSANDHASGFDLNILLNRLLQISGNNNSWYFIELVIDVGGLFTWPLDTIQMLEKYIEKMVDQVVENSYNLTLTEQALLINAPLYKKGTKKKKNKPVTNGAIDNIVAADSLHKVQLKSMIKMKNYATGDGDEDIADGAGKLPLYSVERLTI